MRSPLFLIRIVHTVIWLFLASATFYILYSGLFNRITLFTWIAIALIIGEAIILLLFNWSCPLTAIARKFSDSQKENFDIFLPNWLAKYNKIIFTGIFIAGSGLVLFRFLFS